MVMVSIIIKSFNRPYYLDRCIFSIYENVRGYFEIKVLDDGTPGKYLAKIQQNYPEIEIIKSKNYQEKISAIQNNISSGKEIDGFQIPTQLWIDNVRKAADYVLVTEDDVWFTQKIDIDDAVNQMRSNNIHLLKLGWLGNYKDDKFLKTQAISANIDRIQPKKIFTSNEFIMDLFMYNKFKFFTILYKFRFFDNDYKRRYWALNSILMGLYHKDYWLHIWKDAQERVDEKQQLRNAATWYHKNKKNKNVIARTSSEFMKTTFKSSATNSYHSYGFDFDVNYFNYLLNEAWLEGKFDSMQNFPDDFSTEYFEQFFDENIDKSEFEKWIEKFKQQYRNLGAETD